MSKVKILIIEAEGSDTVNAVLERLTELVGDEATTVSVESRVGSGVSKGVIGVPYSFQRSGGS